MIIICIFLEFLSQGGWSDILLNNIQALLISDPIFSYNPMGIFSNPHISKCSMMPEWDQLVPMSGHVEESGTAKKKIATIRDFNLRGSFFCLSTRLQANWLCIGAQSYLFNFSFQVLDIFVSQESSCFSHNPKRHVKLAWLKSVVFKRY